MGKKNKTFGEHMKKENIHVYAPPPFSLEDRMERKVVIMKEFVKIVEDLIGEAANEGFNNTRK